MCAIFDDITKHVTNIDDITKHVTNIDDITKHVTNIDDITKHVINIDDITKHVINIGDDSLFMCLCSHLGDNPISSLPAGMFEGLSNITTL
jgi:hypothetical protein